MARILFKRYFLAVFFLIQPSLIFCNNSADQENRRVEYLTEDMEANHISLENYSHPYIFISLGNCCKIAWFIKDTDLNSYSYPFDWFISPCDAVCDLIENNFKNFLLPQNLNNLGSYCRTTDTFHPLHNNSMVIDTAYDIEIRHDFIVNIPIESQLEKVMQKYQRRINRLNRALQQTNLPVYLVRKQITRAQAERLSTVIGKRFPLLNFTLIALDNTVEIQENWNIPHVKNFYFDNPTFRYDQNHKKYVYDPSVRFDLWQAIVDQLLSKKN